MSALQQRWANLEARYKALTQRERVLVAVALIIGPWLIGHTLFVAPLVARNKALESSLLAELASVAQMQAETNSLQQQLSIDPDAPNKAEYASLGVERDQLDARLREFGAALVRPEQMNGLLERLLARQSGLQLVSLKTLPPTGLLQEQAGKGDGKTEVRRFDLYRHGVEIRMEGGYAQLQSYLQQLEKLQQRLLWGSLAYRVIDYPKAEMTLVVYTLSPDKSWLAL